MSDQIILRFLHAGLVNVGGDDAKLEKLRETATDLTAALKKMPSKTVPFALVAFDPDAPEEDPVVKEVVEALAKRWATYVNTFSGRPVGVLRALLLEALVHAASENDKIAAAFVASARNVLPYMEGRHEQAIWADVLTELEKRVDTSAETEWATPETINVPAMVFEPPAALQVTTPKVAIDKAALAKRIEGAAGPQNAQGQPTSGNQYWPNQQAAWITEFGSRLADAIIEVHNAVAQGSAIKPIDLSGPLQGLAQAVSGHVDEALKAVAGATAGLQRRTSLIWWKESLYSPSTRLGYRGMKSSCASALMAFDLHRQVPTLSPASVAAFLREAVLSLLGAEANASCAIRDLLVEALGSADLAPLRQAAAELVPEPTGRGPLLGILGHGNTFLPLDDRTFRQLTGVSAESTLTNVEWATHVFRELQAARATQDGTEVKKRGRRS